MSLSVEVVESVAMPSPTRQAIVDLCTEAYDEDFSPLLPLVGPGVHVLGRIDGIPISHAMWVTRWLQVAGRPPLRTAYVEAVATRPSHQRQGFASEILARLAAEIRDHHYQLGALSPSDDGFYARLGWERWRGPLFVRTDTHLEPTPSDSVMIIRLPGTPADLDPTQPLSAEWRQGELW
jgi:aminoglycoside 2'-N-acetyltransferase I